MRPYTVAPHSRSALASLVLCCALAAGCGLFGDPEVYLANGLDEAVLITINDVQYELAGRDQSLVRVPTGPASIRTTAIDGSTIEVLDVTVERGNDVQLYNVLGAAPAFKWYWYFTVDPNHALNLNAPEVTTYQDRSWLVLDHIDWVLREAPDQVAMSENGGVATRTSFEISPGGWRDTALVLMLDAQGGDADAREFVTRLGARADMALVQADLQSILSMADAGTIPSDSLSNAIIEFRARQ